MIDLKGEFRQLLHVVAEYHAGRPERITDVIYMWWKVYHLMNCKLREAKTFPEKATVIEEFKLFVDDLNTLYEEFEGSRFLGGGEGDDIDPESEDLPFVISNLLKMLYLERDLLAKTIKLLKREKQGKKTRPHSVRKKRKNWLKE